MVVDICSCKEENVEEDHFRKIQGIGLEVEYKRGEGDIWHEFVKDVIKGWKILAIG